MACSFDKGYSMQLPLAGKKVSIRRNLVLSLVVGIVSAACDFGATKAEANKTVLVHAANRVNAYQNGRPKEILINFATKGASELIVDLHALPPEINSSAGKSVFHCRLSHLADCNLKLSLNTDKVLKGQLNLVYQYKDLSARQPQPWLSSKLIIDYKVSGWSLVAYDQRCDVNPNSHHHCYANAIQPLALDSHGRLYWGDDNGQVWQVADQEAAHSIYSSPRHDPIAGLAIDKQDNLYFTTVAVLGGSLWGYSVTNSQLLNAGKPLYSWNWYAPSVVAASAEAGAIYVNTASGDILSKAAAANEFQLQFSAPAAGVGLALVIDNESGLYLAQRGTLFYHALHGPTRAWSILDNGGRVNCLAVAGNNSIYAGWQNGEVHQYVSWKHNLLVGSSLPRPVMALAWSKSSSRLFAGSGGFPYVLSVATYAKIVTSSGNDVWSYDGESWLSTGLAQVDSTDVYGLIATPDTLYAALGDGVIYKLAL